MGRHRTLRQRGAALIAAVTLALALTAPAAAGTPAGGAGIRAVLDGRAIALDQVARYACHDRDLPVIRCFGSAADRDRDMAGPRLSPDGLAVTYYVTAYLDASYSPTTPSFTAYWSEPDLTIYGWNDRISSFRTFNGGQPRWWQDVGYKGTGWSWGTQPMPYVGDPANDQFSAVERL
jgi:hypothetical protein